MKSLMLLWKKVAEESATWCCTSATRDFKTVSLRVKHEGLSFLTITLPDFGKDFERCLADGRVDRRSFLGFRRKAELPLFLGGFLDLVFDRGSGVLLDDPSIDAIRAVRQLTLMFGKIQLPCSDARVRKAMAGYVKCEQDVREFDALRSHRDKRDFHRLSSLLFAECLTEVDLAVYQNELIPKHGPGATADALRGNGKYRQVTWPARLEEILPSGEFLLPNWSFLDQFQAMDILEPGQETPVRVIPVPKTLKTPRIIGIEPTAMQYAQQSILPELLVALSRQPTTNSCLGFMDQQPNQRLAMEGSQYGHLATLDLSEASDRVSNQLVKLMCQNHPHLAAAVQACRSTKADVLGEEINLAKFASMGSALTFPIEAMVFLVIVAIGIERELNTHFSRQDLFQVLGGRVRIYGDDIIVPVEYVRSVVSSLSDFGLVVNSRKSFWTGKFRESCGKEYYDGEDVSIVRVRQMFPASQRDATEVISLVSLRNQFYFAGYWETCRMLDREIGRVLKHFPVVLPTSSVLGRHSFLGYDTERLHKTLHSPLVKGWVVSAISPKDPLDGMGALVKFFLRTQRRDRYSMFESYTPEPTLNEDHLERSGRPHAVNIKLRMASPF